MDTPLGPEALEFMVALEDAHANQLITLVTGCYSEYAHEGVVYDADGVDSDLAHIESVIKGQGGEAFGILLHGTLVASGAYAPSKEFEAFEIKRFYMVKKARGGGLAAAFLSYLESGIKEKGGHKATLWTDTRFTRAHRFYEREGYQKMPETRRLNDLSDTIEYRYEKAL